MITRMNPNEDDKSAPVRTSKVWYRTQWFKILAIAAVSMLIIVLALSAGFYARERAAISACHDAAIEQAKYPGAAEIVATNTEIDSVSALSFHVSGAVDFANGWGTPVRHTYFCNATSGFIGASEVTKSIVLEGSW